MFVVLQTDTQGAGTSPDTGGESVQVDGHVRKTLAQHLLVHNLLKTMYRSIDFINIYYYKKILKNG